jgi:hypothetical protein
MTASVLVVVRVLTLRQRVRPGRVGQVFDDDAFNAAGKSCGDGGSVSDVCLWGE